MIWRTADRFGKMPTTSVLRRLSLFSLSGGLFNHTCFQWDPGKPVNARMSAPPSASIEEAYGNRSLSWSTTLSNSECTSSAAGYWQIVRTIVAPRVSMAVGRGHYSFKFPQVQSLQRCVDGCRWR